MKLIKITILASLFLFSCSSDDDAGPKYKAGWNDQLIELSAQECAEGPEGIDIEFCRCSTKEAAKLFTLEEVVANNLSDAQNEKLLRAIINNCDVPDNL